MVVLGEPLPGVTYKKRAAAYVVIVEGDTVAVVKGRNGYFLPGGGSLPGETPAETAIREVREELGLGVSLTREIGTARQYFAAGDEGFFDMRATFFRGALATDEPASGNGEHALFWLPVADKGGAFFHACHAWAVKVVVLSDR